MASSAKRGLDLQLQEADDKKSPDYKKTKKEKKEKKEKKSKKEKRQEEADHWRSQASNTPQRPHPTEEGSHQISPVRKESVRAYSEARSAVSRASISTEARTGDQRLHTAEQDIDQLFNDTNVLFSGLKQVQRQQAYLMQRDTMQARKEANTQVVIANWPPSAHEHDRDRIVDWLIGRAQIPNREFQHASHKVYEDTISRISILHFRSVWATKKFLETCKKLNSGKSPLPYWDADNTVPQDSTGRPFYLNIRESIR